MSFKANLRKKMEIDRLARKVEASLTASQEVQKVDRESMRTLLDYAGYSRLDVRDLELYRPPESREELLALDSRLAFYRTNVDDVAMRKSPTVKEMVNPRNIVRILKDSDVVGSKKMDSLSRVRREAVNQLDLSYTSADLEEIRWDGAAALDGGYPDGVIETLDMFAEILGWRPPPKAFRIEHCVIYGASEPRGVGETSFGPAVVYNRIHNRLSFIEEPISSSDPDRINWFQRIAEAKEPAPIQGPEALGRIAETAKRQKPAIA